MKRLLMILICAVAIVALNAQQPSELQGTSDVSKSRKTEIKKGGRSALSQRQSKSDVLSPQQPQRTRLSESRESREPGQSVLGPRKEKKQSQGRSQEALPKEKQRVSLEQVQAVSGEVKPQVKEGKTELSAFERLPEWQSLTPVQQNKLRELQQIDAPAAQKEMVHLLLESGAIEQAKALETKLADGEQPSDGKKLAEERKRLAKEGKRLAAEGKKVRPTKQPLTGTGSPVNASGVQNPQTTAPVLRSIDEFTGNTPVRDRATSSAEREKVSPLPLNANALRAVLRQTAARIQEEPQEGPQFAPPAGNDGPSYAPGDRLLREGFERSGNNLPVGWEQTAQAGSAQWEITEDIGASAGWPVPAYTGTRYAGINGLNNGVYIPTDAWLYSRGINLTGGKQYTIRFYAYMFGYSGPENVDLYIGTEQTPSGMETLLWNSITAGKMKYFDIYYYPEDDDTWEEFTVTFTPLYTGIYYLGFYDNTTYWNTLFAGIDNVIVTELASNDLSIIPAGAFYAQVPKSQVAVTANVRNVGEEEQTNVVFSAALNGSPAFGSAPVIPSLLPGVSSNNLNIIAPSNPTGFVNGINTVYYNVTADQSEEAPDDNTASATFTGHDIVYAYDNVVSFTNGVGLTGMTASLGNIFPVYNDAFLSAIQVGFGSDVPVGYSVSLYKMNGDLTYNPVDLLGVGGVTATRGQAGWALVPVTPVALEAGSRYFLCVNQLTTSNIALAYDENPSRVCYYFTQNNGTLISTTGFGGLAVRMVLQNEACSAGTPVSLSVEPGQTSAIFSWEYIGDVFGYILTLNDGQNTSTYFTSDKSILISGLTHSTNYTWTVQAACDAQELGTAENGTPFLTLSCITPLPWSENFNSGLFLPSCWTTVTPEGIPGWTSMTTTTYVRSAPRSAIRIFDSGEQDDWLISPPLAIPATGVYELSFWSYNIYPGDYGKNSVLVSTTGTDTIDFAEIWAPESVSAEWVETKLHLGTYVGDTIYIAFRYQGDYAHAWALDDIAITQIVGKDAALVEITEPSGVVHTATDAVTVVLKNNGGEILNDIPVAFEVDGVLISAETVTVSGGLLPGSTYSYTFSATADLSANGQHLVRAYTAVSGDVNAANNALSKRVTTCSVSGLPLSEGFEAELDLCWTSLNPGNIASNAPVRSTTTARTGSYSWRFSSYALASNYDQYLITPPLPTADPKRISFYYNTLSYSSEHFQVGYSVTDNEVAHFTWLTYESPGATNGWVEYSVLVPAEAQHIAIRYYGNWAYYLYVDDITITAETPYSDAAVISIDKPSGTGHTATDSVVVVLKNEGTNTLTSIPVGLVVDGIAVATETVTIPGGLSTGGTYQYGFTATADLSLAGTHTVLVYTALSGDATASNDTLVKQLLTCLPSALPLYEGFEAELGPCWLSLNPGGVADNAPVRSITTARTGSYSWRFSSYYSASNYYQYLVTPVLPTVRQKNIQFYYYRANSGDGFTVGYSTTDADISSFTWLTGGTLGATGTWHEYNAIVPVEAKYIVIRYYGNYAYYLYVDDITISEVLANDVSLIAIDQPTGTSHPSPENVTIVVSNVGTQDVSNVPVSYEVDGIPVGSGTITGTLAAGSSTTYTFTTPADLSVNGTHTIYAYTLLPSDENTQNDTLSKDIVTCGVISLPLYEGFEYLPYTAATSYTPPQCWTSLQMGTNTSNRPGRSTTTPHAGSYSWRFSSYSSDYTSYDQYLISQELGTGVNKVISFYYRHSSSYGYDKIRVGYSITDNDVANFTWDNELTSTTAWSEYQMTIPANAKYVAIYYTGNYDYYIFVDDITISELFDNDAALVSIDQPAGVASPLSTVRVTIKNAGTQPITNLPLGFDAGGVTQASETYTGTLAPGSSDTYTFTASATLTQGITQTIRAYTGLSNDQYRLNDTATKDVYVCGPITVLPHTEGFEYLPYTAATSYTPPQCWTSLQMGTNTYNRPGRSATTVHTGSYSWRFSSSSSDDVSYDQYLISPELGTGVSKVISFNYRFNSTYYDDRISVGYSTTGNDIASFSWGQEIYASNTEWQELQTTIPANATYVAIHYTGTWAYYVYVDDITISELFDNDAVLVSIDQPADMASPLSTVRVTIKNAGTQPITNLPLGFDVDGVTQAGETYTGTLAPGSSDTYTFTASATLTPGLTQTIRAYTGLSNDQYRLNDTVTKDVYVCGPITVFPHTEGFEYLPYTAATSYTPPQCWTSLQMGTNTSNRPGRSATTVHTGSYSWRFSSFSSDYASYDQYLISPELGTGVNKVISFYYRHYTSSNDRIKVGYSTTGNDITNFTWANELTSTTAWSEYQTMIPANAKYFAIHYTGNYAYYIYVDDITISEVPPLEVALESIVRPFGVSHTVPESVEIVIRNNGSDTLYSIPAGYDVDGGTAVLETVSIPAGLLPDSAVTFTFATLADLTALGDHTFRAYTLLPGDGNTANDTLVRQLTTCNVGILPWFEGFENATFPPSDCWKTIASGGTQNWARVTSPTHTGTGAADHIDAIGAQDNWLITSPIAIPASAVAELSFWSYNGYPGYYGRNSVLLSVSGTDISDFVELWSPYAVTAAWEETKFILPDSVAGQTIYLAFRYQGNWSHEWILDDISIIQLLDNDARVESITQPSGPNHPTPEPVTIVVTNHGVQPLDTIPVAYVLDGGVPVLDTIIISGGLNLGATTVFTFTVPVDISAAGVHTLTVYTATDTLTIEVYTCGGVFNAPYYEGFEGITDVTDHCWTTEGNPYWQVYLDPTIAHSGSNSVLHNYYPYGYESNWLISPPIAIPTVGSYELRFWSAVVDAAYYGKNSVWISNTGNQPNDFVQLWTPSSTPPEAQLPNPYEEIVQNLAAYAGDTIYIAFRYEGDFAHAWLVDDISVTRIPEAPAAPTNLTGTLDGSQTFSTLTWTNPDVSVTGASLTDLDSIVIVRNGVVVATIPNPAIGAAETWVDNTITGSSTYVIYGVNDEGVGEIATIVVCFTTYVVPFVEDFEGLIFPPDCWATIAAIGAQSWTSTTASAYVHTGSQAAWRGYSESAEGNQDNWLISPAITIPSTGYYELRFWSKDEWPGDYGKSSVLISTTGIDPSGFTEIWSPTSGTSPWRETFLDLTAYAGQTINIAFRYEGSFAHSWALDDVEIREMANDIAITNVTVRSGALGHSEPVAITIHSNGAPVTATVPLTLLVNCVTYTVNVDLSLGSYADTTVFVNADMVLPIPYNLEATVTYTDDDAGNNSFTATAQGRLYNPFQIWNFNDGQIPNDFTLLTLDNGSPYYVGNFPNNEAWVTLSYDAVQQYMAMSTSWFDPVGDTANRWMITPEIIVPQNGKLIWKGIALDPSYADGYEVKLSTAGINPSDFTTTLFSTPAERDVLTEHEVDLIDYVGESVYIAFIENSYDKYVLLIDDITIAGDTTAVICSGEEYTYVPAILEGSTVTWNRTAIPGINGGLPGSGTGIISEALVNTTSQPIMVVYRVTYIDGCGTYTSPAYVLVYPKAELTSTLTPPAVCSDFVVSYEYESSVPNANITWERLPATGIVDANGQAANSGVGDVYEVLTNTLNVPVPVTYRYTLKTAGCINTQDVQIVITPRPTKPNVWALGNLTFCAGDSVTIKAESINADTYRWLINEAETGVTIGEYTTPATLTAGIYTITVSAISVNECTSDTTAITFTVNNIPTAPALTPAGDLVFCEGTAGSVTLTAGTVTGAVAYEWYKNGIWLEGVSGTTYFTSESGTYSVRAVNAIGCASPLAVPVTVVTLPLPTTPIVTLSGALEFCEGESALLQANAIDAATYTWYRNGGVLAGQTASLIEVTESGSYSVEVVSSNNCPAPPLRSETIVITVNAKPAQPSITFSPAGNVICEGDSRTLQIPTVPNATYNWYKDGLQVLNNSTSASLLITEAGFYQAEVVSDKGCISPISTPVELIVNPIPATPVITGDASACVGETILLTAESAGASTYVWYMNDIEVQRGISRTYEVQTILITANTTNTYTVKTISASGCSSTVSAGKVVEIEVYPDEPLIKGDPLVRKTRGSSYTFEVLTPDGDLQYQWYHAPKQTPEHRASAPVELWDGQGATLLRTNIQLSDAGEYYVIAITPKAGCFTKSAPVELLVEDEIKASNIITANGDGQNDRWIIEGLDTYKSNELRIVNRNGNEVYRTSNYPTTEDEQKRTGWDGQNLPDGVYFYSIALTDKDETVIKRTGYVTLKH